MNIFLVGVSCVGKTTIGAHLARHLAYAFFDFDKEVEEHFGEGIGALSNRFLTPYSYRKAVAPVLSSLLNERLRLASVLALPPSGLHAPFYRLIRATDGVIVALSDEPENILRRITFYDDHGSLLPCRPLSSDHRNHYLREIREDISYFRRFHAKADLQLNLAGLNAPNAAMRLAELIALKCESDR